MLGDNKKTKRKFFSKIIKEINSFLNHKSEELSPVIFNQSDYLNSDDAVLENALNCSYLSLSSGAFAVLCQKESIKNSSEIYFGLYGLDNKKIKGARYFSRAYLSSPTLRLMPNNKIGIFYTEVAQNKVSVVLSQSDPNTGINTAFTSLFTVNHATSNTKGDKFLVEILTNGTWFIIYPDTNNNLNFRKYDSNLVLIDSVATNIPFTDNLQISVTNNNILFFYKQAGLAQPIMQASVDCFNLRKQPISTIIVPNPNNDIVNFELIKSTINTNSIISSLVYTQSGTIKIQSFDGAGMQAGSVLIITKPNLTNCELKFASSIEDNQGGILIGFTDNIYNPAIENIYGQIIRSNSNGAPFIEGPEFILPSDASKIIIGQYIDQNNIALLVIGKSPNQIKRANLSLINALSPTPFPSTSPSFEVSKAPSQTSLFASLSNSVTISPIISAPPFQTIAAPSQLPAFSSNQEIAPAVSIGLLLISGGTAIVLISAVLAICFYYKKRDGYKRFEGRDDLEQGQELQQHNSLPDVTEIDSNLEDDLGELVDIQNLVTMILEKQDCSRFFKKELVFKVKLLEQEIDRLLLQEINGKIIDNREIIIKMLVAAKITGQHHSKITEGIKKEEIILKKLDAYIESLEAAVNNISSDDFKKMKLLSSDILVISDVISYIDKINEGDDNSLTDNWKNFKAGLTKQKDGLKSDFQELIENIELDLATKTSDKTKLGLILTNAKELLSKVIAELNSNGQNQEIQYFEDLLQIVNLQIISETNQAESSQSEPHTSPSIVTALTGETLTGDTLNLSINTPDEDLSQNIVNLQITSEANHIEPSQLEPHTPPSSAFIMLPKDGTPERLNLSTNTPHNRSRTVALDATPERTNLNTPSNTPLNFEGRGAMSLDGTARSLTYGD
jgi:hypothetical protein